MGVELPVVVRPCFEQDLQFVQLIYAHHVMTGAGTFELTPPDLKEITARWSVIAVREWPYLVACSPTDPSRIYGFCYAAQFRERPAYAGTFEDSVYVAPNAIGRGVGSALLGVLLSQLETMGVHEVLALIGDSANAASIKVHARKGFREVGILSRVGRKFGRELDVLVMQRSMQRKEDTL
jgi:L-amino acid N-acyltransferase YncA